MDHGDLPTVACITMLATQCAHSYCGEYTMRPGHVQCICLLWWCLCIMHKHLVNTIHIPANGLSAMSPIYVPNSERGD